MLKTMFKKKKSGFDDITVDVSTPTLNASNPPVFKAQPDTPASAASAPGLKVNVDTPEGAGVGFARIPSIVSSPGARLRVDSGAPGTPAPDTPQIDLADAIGSPMPPSATTPVARPPSPGTKQPPPVAKPSAQPEDGGKNGTERYLKYDDKVKPADALASLADKGQIVCLLAVEQFVLAAETTGLIRMWDASNGRLDITYRGHGAAVTCMWLEDDDEILYTGSRDKTVRMWETTTGVCHGVYPQEFSVTGVCASTVEVEGEDTRRLFVGLADGTIKGLTMGGGHDHCSDADRTGEVVQTLNGHLDSITKLIAKGKDVFSASQDRTVKLWDPQTGKCRKTYSGHQGWVVDVTADVDHVYTASADKTVKQWSRVKAACLRTFRFTMPFYATCILASVPGKLVCGCKGSMDTLIWDLTSGRAELLLPGDATVTCLASSEAGTFTGHSNGTVRVWAFGAVPRPDEEPRVWRSGCSGAVVALQAKCAPLVYQQYPASPFRFRPKPQELPPRRVFTRAEVQTMRGRLAQQRIKAQARGSLGTCAARVLPRSKEDDIDPFDFSDPPPPPLIKAAICPALRWQQGVSSRLPASAPSLLLSPRSGPRRGQVAGSGLSSAAGSGSALEHPSYSTLSGYQPVPFSGTMSPPSKAAPSIERKTSAGVSPRVARKPPKVEPEPTELGPFVRDQSYVLEMPEAVPIQKFHPEREVSGRTGMPSWQSEDRKGRDGQELPLKTRDDYHRNFKRVVELELARAQERVGAAAERIRTGRQNALPVPAVDCLHDEASLSPSHHAGGHTPSYKGSPLAAPHTMQQSTDADADLSGWSRAAQAVSGQDEPEIDRVEYELRRHEMMARQILEQRRWAEQHEEQTKWKRQQQLLWEARREAQVAAAAAAAADPIVAPLVQTPASPAPSPAPAAQAAVTPTPTAPRAQTTVSTPGVGPHDPDVGGFDRIGHGIVGPGRNAEVRDPTISFSGAGREPAHSGSRARFQLLDQSELDVDPLC